MRSAGPISCAAALLSVLPWAAHAEGPSRQADRHFTIDPVADLTLTGGGAAFAALLGLVLSTGEIKPDPVQVGDENKLLGIDSVAVRQTLDPNAATYSTIGLWTAIGFSALDPLLSGYRDGWDAALVDAVMYAETLSLTEAIANVTKIAVRRPRPTAYIDCTSATSSASGACSSTDLQLSFFSGHAATVGAVTATATYLAFIRSPHTVRPWITLAAGTLLTTFVSYERVRSGNHFPTDVIAGALAGAAIGVLVPHLHRRAEDAPHLWIGLAPIPGGASLNVQGLLL